MQRRDIGFLVTGLGLGAGLMYWIDPNLGRRRRAVAADKTKHLAKSARRIVKQRTLDLGHRAKGKLVEASRRWLVEHVSDDILVDRVRSAMGRVVSRPRLVEVSAHEGKVTLAGAVPSQELDSLLTCVLAVRGVASVEDRLSVPNQPAA